MIELQNTYNYNSNIEYLEYEYNIGLGNSQAGPPAHQSPSVKPQTLDPQLSLQQFQVQGAGWRGNHHTPFRVFEIQF